MSIADLEDATARSFGHPSLFHFLDAMRGAVTAGDDPVEWWRRYDRIKTATRPLTVPERKLLDAGDRIDRAFWVAVELQERASR